MPAAKETTATHDAPKEAEQRQKPQQNKQRTQSVNADVNRLAVNNKCKAAKQKNANNK